MLALECDIPSLPTRGFKQSKWIKTKHTPLPPVLLKLIKLTYNVSTAGLEPHPDEVFGQNRYFKSSVGLVYIRMGIYNVFILLENFVLGTSIYNVCYKVFYVIPLKIIILAGWVYIRFLNILKILQKRLVRYMY